MRIHPNVVVLLSVFALAACGGSTPEAKGPDPWSDFTGKYSTPAASHGNTSTAKSEAARHEAKSKAEAKEQTEEAPPAPAKKTSKATIRGESVSTISDAALADASKGALKTKQLSTKIVTGAQYEQVSVQLKGARVQIIRPATGETGSAAVDAPKARSGALSKGEAGWYDEDADVLVIVEAGKKKASEKALDAIVSR